MVEDMWQAVFDLLLLPIMCADVTGHWQGELKPRAWSRSNELGPTYSGGHWSLDGTWERREDQSVPPDPTTDLYSTIKYPNTPPEINPNRRRDKEAMEIQLSPGPKKRGLGSRSQSSVAQSNSAPTKGGSLAASRASTVLGGNTVGGLLDDSLRREVEQLAQRLQTALQAGSGVSAERVTEMQEMLRRSEQVVQAQKARAPTATPTPKAGIQRSATLYGLPFHS